MAVKTGTNAADTLEGGEGPDVILGYDGNDTVNGGADWPGAPERGRCRPVAVRRVRTGE